MAKLKTPAILVGIAIATIVGGILLGNYIYSVQQAELDYYTAHNCHVTGYVETTGCISTGNSTMCYPDQQPVISCDK